MGQFISNSDVEAQFLLNSQVWCSVWLPVPLRVQASGNVHRVIIIRNVPHFRHLIWLLLEPEVDCTKYGIYIAITPRRITNIFGNGASAASKVNYSVKLELHQSNKNGALGKPARLFFLMDSRDLMFKFSVLVVRDNENCSFSVPSGGSSRFPCDVDGGEGSGVSIGLRGISPALSNRQPYK